MVVVKVKTEIMASITSSMIEQAVKLVILYAETFTANVIVFIGNVALTTYCPIFFSIRVSLLMLTISFSKIKGEIYKLLIKIHIYISTNL